MAHEKLEEVKKEEVKGDDGEKLKTESEVTCDDMYSLHYEIVFRRVTKVSQIEEREHEL